MEGNTQAFIVRIWFEETNGEAAAFIQRGTIEHVSSKRRLFFREPAEMLGFIKNVMGSQCEDSSHQSNTNVDGLRT